MLKDPGKKTHRANEVAERLEQNNAREKNDYKKQHEFSQFKSGHVEIPVNKVKQIVIIIRGGFHSYGNSKKQDNQAGSDGIGYAEFDLELFIEWDFIKQFLKTAYRTGGGAKAFYTYERQDADSGKSREKLRLKTVKKRFRRGADG